MSARGGRERAHNGGAECWRSLARCTVWSGIFEAYWMPPWRRGGAELMCMYVADHELDLDIWLSRMSTCRSW